MQTLTVNLSEIGPLDDKLLYRLCASNRELRIERTAKGELIAMSPSGIKSGSRNAALIAALHTWNNAAQLGHVVDSSAGFLLNNGAMRSPDAAWISNELWSRFSEEDLERFVPACPDFVAEIMSPSDVLSQMQDKLREWIANGCKLGWLVDPKSMRAYIYRQHAEVEVVDTFSKTLSGEDILPHFEFPLAKLR